MRIHRESKNSKAKNTALDCTSESEHCSRKIESDPTRCV